MQAPDLPSGTRLYGRWILYGSPMELPQTGKQSTSRTHEAPARMSPTPKGRVRARPGTKWDGAQLGASLTLALLRGNTIESASHFSLGGKPVRQQRQSNRQVSVGRRVSAWRSVAAYRPSASPFPADRPQPFSPAGASPPPPYPTPVAPPPPPHSHHFLLPPLLRPLPSPDSSSYAPSQPYPPLQPQKPLPPPPRFPTPLRPPAPNPRALSPSPIPPPSPRPPRPAGVPPPRPLPAPGRRPRPPPSASCALILAGAGQPTSARVRAVAAAAAGLACRPSAVPGARSGARCAGRQPVGSRALRLPGPEAVSARAMEDGRKKCRGEARERPGRRACGVAYGAHRPVGVEICLALSLLSSPGTLGYLCLCLNVRIWWRFSFRSFFLCVC